MFIVSVMRRCKDEILLQYVYKVFVFYSTFLYGDVDGDGDGFSVLSSQRKRGCFRACQY